MANRFDILMPLLKGVAKVQEFVEETPGLREVGGFLRQRAEKSFEAQRQLSELQAKLAFGAVAGRQPTLEELAKVPIVDFGVGSLEKVGAKALNQAADTALSKLVSAVKSAKPARKEIEKLASAERGIRAGRAAGVLEQVEGERAFIQAKGQLKGELVPEKPRFEPLRAVGEKAEEKLSQSDIDNLFIQIQRHPDLSVYDKISAADGFGQLLKGVIPQPSKLSLIEDVFGKELIQETLKKRPLVSKALDVVTSLVNIPRSLMASFDMSAPLRQGVIFTLTKPTSAFRAGQEMFRQAFSEINYAQWLSDIKKDPLYRVMRDSGLYIADSTKISQGLIGREEAFMTNYAEKIPLLGRVVRASERAYGSYLNKLRTDVFSNIASKFIKEGLNPKENEELFKGLAEFINNATGRGSLGSFNRSAQVLNTLFFSPRLIASRFNLLLNPGFYAKLPGPVRKEAIKSFAEFVGIGLSVLGIAKMSGAEVEYDPRSTDFGKIKVGNTRWDIWGGFQQWARVFAQLVSGQRKTPSGEIIPLSRKKFPFESRKDVAGRFFEYKLAPIPGEILNILRGEKLFGEELKVSKELKDLVTPLYIQGIQEAYQELGPWSLVTTGLPAFFGVGLQTYQEKRKESRFSF